ncbi:MAG: hypothetical protein LBU27_01260 [Candidatus Peribacteria bacterium]|jgi:hypothetical protein|nr:hypothetical protein [Candidatus Peribacteria bacterium]
MVKNAKNWKQWLPKRIKKLSLDGEYQLYRIDSSDDKRSKSPLGNTFTRIDTEYQSQLINDFLSGEKECNIGFELIRQNKKPKIRLHFRDGHYS